MSNYALAGPEGFFRTTFILQETEDSWPVVYVWESNAEATSGPIVRWVFKGDPPSTEQQNCEWDDHSDNKIRYEFDYIEWWAFIYYMATNAEDGEGSVLWEQKFFDEVIQPQSSEEKSND